MPVRAILFDLDGTLVDSTIGEAEAIARALRRLTLELGPAERDFPAGRTWDDIHAWLESAHGHLAWTPDQLGAATAAERAAVFAELGLPLQPGARAALDRFAHLPIAVVTGSVRAEAEQALDLCHLRHHIRALVAAEDVPRGKPAPDGFLAAAALLGVEPSECLVVEDSAEGIAAGLAAGCRVVAIAAGNAASDDQSAAHRILATLELLTLELLDELGRDPQPST
jgi:HAD superfamily hydrolase (TIGR01509 family)